MSRQQKRINHDNLAPFMISGELLNIVMKNRAVYFGRVLGIESSSVKLKNTKGHVLHLPLDQIEEIWFDEKVVKNT